MPDKLVGGTESNWQSRSKASLSQKETQPDGVICDLENQIVGIQNISERLGETNCKSIKISKPTNLKNTILVPHQMLKPNRKRKS